MRRPHFILLPLLYCAASACLGFAAPADKPATPDAQAAPQAPPKPANNAGERKIESAIAGLDIAANPPKITLRDGAMTLALKPTTKLVQEERGLTAADLKVGDTICLLTLKSVGLGARTLTSSIKQECTVKAVNPLTLAIGDMAALTITKTEVAEFSREIAIQPANLAIGQTVALKIYLRGDGDIDVLRCAVVTAKPKAKKPPRTKKKA